MKQSLIIIVTFLGGLLIFPACSQKVLVKAPKVNLDPLPLDAAIDGEDRTDPFEGKQWNLAKVEAKSTWRGAATSKAVVVMLAGTGIDYNHQDLRANVMVNTEEMRGKDPVSGKIGNQVDDDGDGLVDNFVGWDFVDDDGLAYDQYGYDTYLAGIIGAVHNNGKGIKGILNGVSLYPVRYINNNGQSNVPTLVRMLNHIKVVKPHVVLLNLINLKFDSDATVKKVEIAALKKALTETKNYPIVIGAGNNGSPFGGENEVRQTFAGFDHVFVVTSIDVNGKKPFLANFSSQYVHTSAPGEDVLTTAPGNSYAMVSSTNIAAAHVAAAIALGVNEMHGQMNYREFFKILMSDAGSSTAEEFERYSVGRNTLNLSRYLNELQK